MKCPCCNNKMKHKHKEWYGYPFSTGPEPDYPSLFTEDKYKCKECNIKNINGEWKIPKEYSRPTQKQINTVLFINNYLEKDFEPLLKEQCQKFIGKYLDDAIKVKEQRELEFAEEIREWYGEFDYY